MKSRTELAAAWLAENIEPPTDGEVAALVKLLDDVAREDEAKGYAEGWNAHQRHVDDLRDPGIPLSERIERRIDEHDARIKNASAPGMPVSYGEGRCEVCGWTLAATVTLGCVPGNCSLKPHEGSDEYRRIQRRRKELAEAKAKGDL